MKILQLQDKPVGTEWQYKFSIFSDEENGTELNHVGREIPCRKPPSLIIKSVVQTYKDSFKAKEVYVSTNGQGTERD